MKYWSSLLSFLFLPMKIILKILLNFNFVCKEKMSLTMCIGLGYSEQYSALKITTVIKVC